MRVQITQRHCEIPDSLRTRAHELAERLTRFDSRVSGVELVFEEKRQIRRVEGIVTRDRTPPVLGRGEASEWTAALDVLFDRLIRQVRKTREQAVDRQATPTAGDPLAE